LKPYKIRPAVTNKVSVSRSFVFLKRRDLAMYRYHRRTGVVGKMLHLALLGVAILFVGPIALGIGAALLGVVVAIVGVALPFVVIGGLGYGPYLLVRRMFGPPRPRLALHVRRPLSELRRVPPEVRRAEPAAATFRSERVAVPERRRSVVARVAGEVLCGALVGGVLGVVALVGMAGEWQTSTLIDYSALGAGIGAVVGFVVGGPRPVPVEQTPAVG
jgi:hypothetical protein